MGEPARMFNVTFFGSKNVKKCCPNATKSYIKRGSAVHLSETAHRENMVCRFHVLRPRDGDDETEKYMLDSIKKITERRKRAAEMIDALLRQLRAGWSPWVDVESNRGYTLLDDALKKYEANLERLPKKKTRQSYASRLAVMREYIAGMVLPPRYVYQYDTAFVSDFLDWLYFEREVSGRTRNNYRGWCSSLAAFLMERDYIAENPVAKIRNVAENPKNASRSVPPCSPSCRSISGPAT